MLVWEYVYTTLPTFRAPMVLLAAPMQLPAAFVRFFDLSCRLGSSARNVPMAARTPQVVMSMHDVLRVAGISPKLEDRYSGLKSNASKATAY